MIIILILIGVVTLGLVAFLTINYQKTKQSEPEEEPAAPVSSECCGAHEICEAETLLTLSDKIVYYSDEELDAYRGTASDAYSREAIDEFRDVLLTLQQHEVAGWLKSLQLRRIEIPDDIREEALMLMEEFREQRMENRKAKEQAKDNK